MIKILNKIPLLLILLATLSACSQFTARDSLALDLSTTEPDRVRFSGKGAGAGMMMSASMGVMGIAIGVAIDEGIGKDIHESAMAAGMNIHAVIEKALRQSWQEQNQKSKLKQNFKVSIERYGFVSTSGEDDPAAPQLHLTIQPQGEQSYQVKFPEDFSDTALPRAPLEELKTDGKLAIRLFTDAARRVAAEAFNRSVD